MTGTSIDGVDAAIARLEGPAAARRVELLHHVQRPLGPLGNRLRQYAEGEALTAGELDALAHALGEACADAVAEAAGHRLAPQLVALHGQTVLHQPPRSVAIVDPWPCALRFTCPVVTDLRALNIAQGGEGAPITPIADQIIFGGGEVPMDIVNLGGFCNVTRLAPDRSDGEIDGFDVCACNQVLDEAARRLLDKPWDDQGKVASSGTVHPELAERIQLESITSQDARSMGTGDEGHDALELVAHLDTPDQLATIASAIAGAIAATIPGTSAIHLFGGGVHNQALVQAIERLCPGRSVLLGHRACPPGPREALAMAVLGDRAANGEPITVSSLTSSDPTTHHHAGRWIRSTNCMHPNDFHANPVQIM
jgi:1,6-anhydro-N-acetylmuramate kinase